MRTCLSVLDLILFCASIRSPRPCFNASRQNNYMDFLELRTSRGPQPKVKCPSNKSIKHAESPLPSKPVLNLTSRNQPSVLSLGYVISMNPFIAVGQVPSLEEHVVFRFLHSHSASARSGFMLWLCRMCVFHAGSHMFGSSG